MIPALVVIGFVGWLNNPAFLTLENLVNILQQSSELSILVIAETLVLLTARIDLSLESIVGLAPMLGAWLITDNRMLGGSGFGLPVWAGILVVFVAGAIVGAINGFLVVRLKLNAFIATLSMLILLRGLTLGLTASYQHAAITSTDNAATVAVGQRLIDVPYDTFTALVDTPPTLRFCVLGKTQRRTERWDPGDPALRHLRENLSCHLGAVLDRVETQTH